MTARPTLTNGKKNPPEALGPVDQIGKVGEVTEAIGEVIKSIRQATSWGRNFRTLKHALQNPEALLKAPTTEVQMSLYLRAVNQAFPSRKDEEGPTNQVFIDQETFKRQLIEKYFPEQAEAIQSHPKFEEKIWPLMLLFESKRNHITAASYLTERALSTDAENPFIGLRSYSNASVLRLDVASSSQIRANKAPVDAVHTISGLFQAARALLPAYPHLKMVESGGDELVICAFNEKGEIPQSKRERNLEAFAHDIRKYIQDHLEPIDIHVGIGHGLAQGIITQSGAFVFTGPAYRDALHAQEKDKKAEKPQPGERYHRGHGRMIPTPTYNLNVLEPNHPDFVDRLENVMAAVFSSAPHVLDALDHDFGEGTSIMIGFSPPDLETTSPENLYAFWDDFTTIVHNVAAEFEVVPNYHSSDGVIMLLVGVLGSHPMEQGRRAVEFAQTLSERIASQSSIGMKAISIRSGTIHFGALSASSTGLGTTVDRCARQIQATRNQDPSASTHLINPQEYNDWCRENGNGTPILVDPNTANQLNSSGYNLLHPAELTAKFKLSNETHTFTVCEGIEKSPTPPLVGYREERRQMNQVAQRLIQDPSSGPQHVVLTGSSAGIGKSALAEEFRGQLEKDGFLTINHRQSPYENYGLITHTLRHLFNIAPGKTLSQSQALSDWIETHATSQQDAETLRQTLRDLDDDTSNAQPQQSSLQLDEHSQRILAALSTDQAIGIFIDNPTLLDDGSRRVLHGLFAPDQSSRIVLVSTQNTTDKALLPRPNNKTNLIDLNGLTLEATYQLVAQELGLPPSENLAQETKQLIATILKSSPPHNPFLVKKVTQSLMKSGTLAKGKAHIVNPRISNQFLTGKLRISGAHSVDVYVRSQINNLTPHCRQIINAAALLGTGHPLNDLEGLCEALDITISEEDIQAIEATNLMTLKPQISFESRYMESHISDTLKHDLGGQKTKIHATIADRLKDKTGTAAQLERAYHLCQSGQIEQALIEANQVETLQHPNTAIRTYQTILDAVSTALTSPKNHPHLPWPKIHRALIQLAQLKSRSGYRIRTETDETTDIQNDLNQAQRLAEEETILIEADDQLDAQLARANIYYWHWNELRDGQQSNLFYEAVEALPALNDISNPKQKHRAALVLAYQAYRQAGEQKLLNQDVSEGNAATKNEAKKKRYEFAITRFQQVMNHTKNDESAKAIFVEAMRMKLTCQLHHARTELKTSTIQAAQTAEQAEQEWDQTLGNEAYKDLIDPAMQAEFLLTLSQLQNEIASTPDGTSRHYLKAVEKAEASLEIGQTEKLFKTQSKALRYLAECHINEAVRQRGKGANPKRLLNKTVIALEQVITIGKMTGDTYELRYAYATMLQHMQLKFETSEDAREKEQCIHKAQRYLTLGEATNESALRSFYQQQAAYWQTLSMSGDTPVGKVVSKSV